MNEDGFITDYDTWFDEVQIPAMNNNNLLLGCDPLLMFFLSEVKLRVSHFCNHPVGNGWKAVTRKVTLEKWGREALVDGIADELEKFSALFQVLIIRGIHYLTFAPLNSYLIRGVLKEDYESKNN